MPISELTDHIERLKANDNLKFSQEYEVRLHVSSFPVCNKGAVGGLGVALCY